MAFNIKLLDNNDPIFDYIGIAHTTKIQDCEPFEDDSIQNQSFYIKLLKRIPGAVEGNGGEAHTFHLAREGKLRGLSKHITFGLMLEYWNELCQPPWQEAELQIKVNNAYEYSKAPQGCMNIWQAFQDVDPAQYNDQLEKDEIEWAKTRTVKGSDALTVGIHNAMAAFYGTEIPIKNVSKHVDNPLYRLLSYNEFANKICFTRKAEWHKSYHQYWKDQDVYECRKWLDQRRSIAFSKQTMEDAAMQVSLTYKFHPVRDWINSLRWDGEARLDRMLIDYAGSPDTPYVREVSKNTIIAAVARVYQPGCQHDSILVLEGKQGTGKTSFVRILGGEYYADIKIDLNNLERTVQYMQGRWILEASELEFMKRNEAQAIKRFITVKHDIARFAYAHYDQEYPRQSIFIGTVNPDNGEGYLSDTEGNRRYWPVSTFKIDLQGLERDRDQLFAEAYHRYKQGEKWEIKDPKLIKIANEEVLLRVSRDSWQEVLQIWLTQENLPELTGQNIASSAFSLKGREYDKIASNRIGKCMRNLGFERQKKRLGPRDAIYVWYKEEIEDYLDGL
jgi:predicted P-loop ATPase